MDRRTLLGTLSSAGTVAVTGCLSDGGGDGTPSAAGTDTPTPTPAPPTLIDAAFTVVGRQSGTQRDSASVAVDGGNVVVEGTVWGRDGCQTAQLRSVNYSRTTDELTVAIETTERADAGDACSQAVVEIVYRATIAFENGPPSSVVVTHDRGAGPETVTTTSL